MRTRRISKSFKNHLFRNWVPHLKLRVSKLSSTFRKWRGTQFRNTLYFEGDVLFFLKCFKKNRNFPPIFSKYSFFAPPFFSVFAFFSDLFGRILFFFLNIFENIWIFFEIFESFTCRISTYYFGPKISVFLSGRILDPSSRTFWSSLRSQRIWSPTPFYWQITNKSYQEIP